MADLLVVVEAQLGSIDCVTIQCDNRYVLEEPIARVINRIAAFIYVNCFGMSGAVDWYNVCNGMHRIYVDERMGILVG